MKRPGYFGILVFSLLTASVLGQGKLWQAIQLDSSTVIAFRKRVETVPASTAPPRSPIPGFIRILGDTKRYLYDVVLAENGVETVLETLEILRFRDMKDGVYPQFALLAAHSSVPGQIVYVYSTQGKFYVNTATRGSDRAFHKVMGELVAQGLVWERAKLKTGDGILRLYIEGSRPPKVFERQESGSFVLKP